MKHWENGKHGEHQENGENGENGKHEEHKEELIWDPLRKKQVALTPEERVRQWFIGVL